MKFARMAILTTTEMVAVGERNDVVEADTRPIYFMLTFWGRKYAEYFYTLCLPTLLAEGNLPVLRGRKGCKLIICTTRVDWEYLVDRPLMRRLAEFVEPHFIEIAPPGKDDLPQLYMSKAHRLASRKAYADRAYAGFLAPDLLLSDGLIAKALELIGVGKHLVLCPALRFAMEPALERLNAGGFLRPDWPMALSTQFLGGIGTDVLHSEIRRYDFESATFDNYPIWSYWRVPGRSGIVLYTCSWAMLLGDFSVIRGYEDEFLTESTIDGFYIHRNFGHLRESDAVAWLSDSADAMFMSLTPESELSFKQVRIPGVTIPILGYLLRLYYIKRFHSSDVLDPFRRHAYAVPIVIHGEPLDNRYQRVIAESRKTIMYAIAHGDRFAGLSGLLDRVQWYGSALMLNPKWIAFHLARLPYYFLRAIWRVVASIVIALFLVRLDWFKVRPMVLWLPLPLFRALRARHRRARSQMEG